MKATVYLQELAVPLGLLVVAVYLLLLTVLPEQFSKRIQFTSLSFVHACSILLGMVGIVVMIGWIFDVLVLKSFILGFPTMKFTTSIMFVLSGINLFLFTKLFDGNEEIADLFLPITTFTQLIILATVFYSSILGIKTGIGTLFLGSYTQTTQISSGKPSYGTIFSFLLSIIIALSCIFYRRHFQLALTIIGASIAFIGAIAIVGYIFNLPMLYYNFTGVSNAMGLNSAVLFLLFGVSTVLLGKHTHETSI